MSLVPYSSRDSREIVLRHDDTLVLRDPQSKQLVLRARRSAEKLTECPYCHRPLPNSRTSSTDSTDEEEGEGFVSPEYFRLLRSRGAFDEESSESTAPSSPIRRLVEPLLPDSTHLVDQAEFVTSTPESRPGITREAFSPNYFQRFFVEERVLGSGGKGIVLLVRHVLDGVDLGNFACKRVPVGDDHEWLEKVLIEVQLLQGLSHPNLVSYRHSWLQDTQLSRFQPAIPCAFILQEYCNSGDLLHYIIGSGSDQTLDLKEVLKERMRRRSKGQSDRSGSRISQRKLSFDEIFSLFKDITSGLAYLHSQNYIHRDLKPSNCLLHKTDKGLRCLISDFGEVQSENVVRKSTGATGTISYCAPEVLKKDVSGRYGNFTTKSDIFSLGMILYFMCFGRLPYVSSANISEEVEDVEVLREEISRWEGFFQEKAERPDLPEQYYEVLNKLLALDPAERPNAADIEKALLTGTGFGFGNSKTNRNEVPDSLDISKRFTAVESPSSGLTTVGNKTRTTSSAYMEEVLEFPDSSDFEPNPSPTSKTALLYTRRSSSPHKSNPPNPSSPALLMPPPSTVISRTKHRLCLLKHNLRLWLTANQQSLTLTARIALFLFKIALMNWHCASSGTARPELFYPLVALAAADLSLRQGWMRHALLMVVHVVLVEGLVVGGRMCVGRQWLWDLDHLD